MDAIDSVFEPLKGFSKDNVRLIKRCHKPDDKEYYKVTVNTAIGYGIRWLLRQAHLHSH
ncbi:hypothetical protein AAHE18_07G061000 [Arachis hypogaea]